MSADIHPFLPGDRALDVAGSDAPAVDLHGERSVYLDAYLAPFREWLERDTVTEIIVNRPGEVWIEDAAHPGMRKVRRPEIDDRLVQRLAEQVAPGQPPGHQSRAPPARRHLAGWCARAILWSPRLTQALGDGNPPAPPARSAARCL